MMYIIPFSSIASLAHAPYFTHDSAFGRWQFPRCAKRYLLLMRDEGHRSDKFINFTFSAIAVNYRLMTQNYIHTAFADVILYID